MRKSSTLSTRSWRTSRARVAPSAARITHSLRLVTARASSRLATLAQAIKHQRDGAQHQHEALVRLALYRGVVLAQGNEADLAGLVGGRILLLEATADDFD